MQQALSRMTPHERTVQSQALCQQILDRLTPAMQTVCAYSALAYEPQLSPALQEMFERNVQVYLPRITDGRMTFHLIHTLDHLEPGTHGILEPPSHALVLEDGTADLVLVPGRAFDRQSNRLGRGKGHYDRWIGQQRSVNAETQFWGIAFECQLIDRLPSESHDRKMDGIILPARAEG